VCDLETSRIGAPYIYIYDISSLRVKNVALLFLENRILLKNIAVCFLEKIMYCLKHN